MKSNQVPEIRFPEFTGDWKQRKLGDILQEFSVKSKIENEYKVLSSTNSGMEIRKGRVSGTSNQGYKIIEDGCLVLSPQNLWLGNININNIGVGLVSPSYKTFKFTKANSKFIGPQLRTQRMLEAYKNASSQGASLVRRNLELDSFYQIAIHLPNDNEQDKIANFFNNMDSTIVLYKGKLDLLKELKKGFLQKMFPKEGEKVPEVRFPGFNDAWELRKFKNLIEELNGGASISPKDYQSEGIRTIPKGAINDSGIANLSDTKFVSDKFFRKNKTSHVSTFELVTSLRDLVPSAPNLGRVVRIEGQDELFLMPQGVYKLTLFPNADENFLISYSNSDIYRKIISQEKNGSTQVHIRNGEFLNINIFVPRFEEQQKIGAFFKTLDEAIALHQRELEILKNTKKAFLQKMFV